MKKIESVDGSFKDENFPPELTSQLDLEQKYVDAVKRGMVGVVNDARGTGHRAKLPDSLGITVGGKTGTAQVVSLDSHREDSNFGHHAWFAGYAPAQDPQIVVAALVEHAGHGGAIAAPIVEKVMEAYFGYVPPVAAEKTKSSDSNVSSDEIPEPPTAEEPHAVD